MVFAIRFIFLFFSFQLFYVYVSCFSGPCLPEIVFIYSLTVYEIVYEKSSTVAMTRSSADRRVISTESIYSTLNIVCIYSLKMYIKCTEF